MSKRLLGVDHGLRRIGLAVSDALGLTTRPLPVLRARKKEEAVAGVLAAAAEQETTGIVIGLPLNMDGSEGEQAAICRRFAGAVAAGTDLPVWLHDERLTTEEARDIMQEAGVKASRRAELVDSLAAAALLRGFLAALEAGNAGAPVAGTPDSP